DPAFQRTLVAACDRVILAQAEYRGHISLHWAYGAARPEDEQARPLFVLQGPDLVVFGDAGQAWLVGNGPGRLPSDRLPTAGRSPTAGSPRCGAPASRSGSTTAWSCGATGRPGSISSCARPHGTRWRTTTRWPTSSY